MAQESIDRQSDSLEAMPEAHEGRDEIANLATVLAILGSQDKLDQLIASGEQFQLGRFAVLGERGRGGFGIVLQAIDPDLQREVALKLPRPDRLLAGESPEQIIREARVAAQLQHPGIVPVYETGRWGEVWYIVAAYCPGPSLGDWLHTRGEPLSEREAAWLLREIATALQHAHARGVLHLDLKPDNILLRSDSASPAAFAPLLTDFGMSSWRRNPTPAGEGRGGGTPEYMAPEQARGDQQEIGVATDLFALGAILVDCLQESFPATDENPSRTRTSRFGLPASVGADLRAVVEKCLASTPAERYASAKELADELQRFLAGQTLLARPVGWPIRALRWGRRQPALAAASALALFAVLSGLLTSTLLWRQAAGNLARYEREARARQVTQGRMEQSLFNLAWVAQNSQLDGRGAPAEFSPESQTIRKFLGELRAWQSTSNQSREGLTSIEAAASSLALLESATADKQVLEQEFRHSLPVWQQVVMSDLERTDRQRALAAHLATFHVRCAQQDWLDWRRPEFGLNAKVIARVEIPYAELLIELARGGVRQRHAEPAGAMLQAAIEILSARGAQARQDEKPLGWLLAARNLAGQVAQLCADDHSAQQHYSAADTLARRLDKVYISTHLLRRECAATFARQGGNHYRAADYDCAAACYNRAGEVLHPILDDHTLAINDVWELVRLHQREALCYRELNQIAEARAVGHQAVETLNAAIARLPACQRVLILRRGIVQSRIARHALELGDQLMEQALLAAAARDFESVELMRSDSIGAWLTVVRTWQALGDHYAASGTLRKSRYAFERSQRTLDRLQDFTKHPRVAEYRRVAASAVARLSMTGNAPGI